MPVYRYKVKNDTGKLFTGEAKMDSEEELRRLLLDKGYTPVEIIEKNVINDISQISLFKPKVKTKDLAIFCRQFSIVLEAGVPIATSLDVLREQTTNRTLRECLDDVYDNIQKGITLSNAMRQHPKIFPEMLINMVEAGEISGQLDLVFKRMAVQFEKENKLNQKIKGALTYPIIVSVVAVAVILILMVKVVPTFVEVLDSFDVEMPIYTKILIAVSNFFKSFWFIIVGALLVIGSAIAYFSRTYEGKIFFGTLAIKLPVIRGVTKNIVTARLTRTLGTLMSSGVLLIQSMEVVQKVLGNQVIKEKIDGVIEEIKKGRGLTTPLAALNYFPPMVISMIRIGEESGNLDFALDKSADFYDEEVEASLAMLTSFIEPVIIIVLALVVGFIVLSVLSPMLSIYDQMSV
ncbi:MAG TPA: type II secretion system F family protein [Acetivibrio sp.]|uniref:type II secretion system F family protein n=1 Tax=Acetivibrio sp. TaxID=1872092 RepID=UPI002CA4C412|nr:type II secretion system F family protein [Acetivibrio sp.]HOM01405.1 type II secretion system F family protein [Acetivibrio sp.]